MAIFENHLFASLNFPAGLRQHSPIALLVRFQKQALPTPAGLLAKSCQLSRNDFRIVQHQTIAGPQHIVQITNMGMIDRRFFTIDHQQTGIFTVGERLLGNERFWQVKIVIVGAKIGVFRFC